jgi:hypothetical protein
MKMRRREHSHEASATGSGAFPNEAIRVLTLIAARQPKSAPRPKSATTSVVVGPRASASQKDVG